MDNERRVIRQWLMFDLQSRVIVLVISRKEYIEPLYCTFSNSVLYCSFF